MFPASRAAALLILSGIVCAGVVPGISAEPSRHSQASPAAAPVVRPSARSDARAGAGSITGRVVTSEGAPVARARVILASPALSEPRVALSAADGSYEFTHLPAGSFTVTVSRSGYATQLYSERAGARGTAIVLTGGQALGRIDVRLQVAGVIAGRILDEDDKPFAGATIDALVRRTEAGQLTLASVATAESDDRGAFRLTGLRPGEYYLSAFDTAFAHVGDENGPLRYSATYFPGVASLDEATRIPVVAGAEPAPVSFKLKIVRPARVSGKLNTPEGKQLLSAAMVMTHVDTAVSLQGEQANILPNGAFIFSNVPPGRYEIRARGETVPGATALFASYRVLVEGRDVSDIPIELLPGATITGQLVFDPGRNGKHPSFSGLRVRAPLVDGRSFADALTGEVTPTGTFSIRGMLPGTHLLTVEGLPDPWLVKQVISRGQDVTDAGLDADARQRFDNVRITLTDTTSEVSGLVRDDRGLPVAEAMVLVIPLAQQFWHPGSRRFGLLRTDSDGRFKIRGLPEGEYRVAASVDVDESDAFRVTVLDRLSETAAPLTLQPLEQRVLDLSLTGPARVRRASRR